MDLIILGISFVFSLVFIILGFSKRSPPLALIGSITLMFLGIFLWTTGIQTTLADYPYSNSTLVETTYSFGEESVFPVGFMIFIFSLFIVLYSMKIWLYGETEE